jgi:putative N-acetylmannosamine-6-phosphate epimerase
VDFDPVTNSQEPDVKSFAVNAEKSDAGTAIIAVTITGRNPPRTNAADAVIRYDFERDAGQWKIDDISGAEDGKPWSLRSMLSDSLKN